MQTPMTIPMCASDVHALFSYANGASRLGGFVSNKMFFFLFAICSSCGIFTGEMILKYILAQFVYGFGMFVLDAFTDHHTRVYVQP